MANQTSGVSLAMVVALAKKYAIQYGSLGIQNVEASGTNGIKFTLAGGQTYTVILSFNAAGINFSNSGTTLVSGNVQDAIVELLGIINNKVQTVNTLNGDVVIEGGENISVATNPTTKKITISAAGSASISDFDLTNTISQVTYDSTNGAEIEGTGEITHEGDTTDTFDTTFKMPIVPGNGISMDATADDKHLEIKAVAEYITINAPTSATNGTLTEEQLAKLQSSENVHIMFNNELYRMQSKGHTEGYITYSMVEYETNVNTVKSITVTISTRGWVLNTQVIGAGDYNDLTNKPIINADLSSITGQTTNQVYRHTGTTTSSFTQYKLYSYDGTEWKEIGAGGGGSVTDVQNASGTSYVVSGVATIPNATQNAVGLVKQATFTIYGSSEVIS